MGDLKPNPSRLDNGLPTCDEENCAAYDGKRCKLTGFQPGTFCEPMLIEERGKPLGESGTAKYLLTYEVVNIDHGVTERRKGATILKEHPLEFCKRVNDRADEDDRNGKRRSNRVIPLWWTQDVPEGFQHDYPGEWGVEV